EEEEAETSVQERWTAGKAKGLLGEFLLNFFDSVCFDCQPLGFAAFSGPCPLIAGVGGWLGLGDWHLVQWDTGNPECLLQLVKELIQQYHHYQCQRLRESSRLLFEYDSLLEDPNYGCNMEIYAGNKNSWTGEFSARFLLKLPVDFSNIPVYLLKVLWCVLEPVYT
uniref:BRCA1-A complex subunit BRE-like n=1 Tax=Monopterus albus TaxID=43700 RepID=UPI0009B399FF